MTGTYSESERLAGFLDKVVVGDPTGCWAWQGGRGGYDKSYGTFWNGSHTVRAHRWSFERFRGPIPDGLVLDHLCRNRLCVRPAHLELVTQRENVRRGQRAQQTHCKRGHEFTDANTLRSIATGRRACRACARLRQPPPEGTARSLRTHCPRGHPYDALNTYVHRGSRHCRACRSEAQRSGRWKRPVKGGG